MYEVVQVRLREGRKTQYFQIGELKPKIGEFVIVEADRGLDYGEVISGPETVSEVSSEEPLRKILRIATKADLEQIKKNREKTREAFTTCQKKIQEHALKMKLIEAEYSFDRSKLLFYFTAEGRIDFRELVKDLARIFKARIELKQIGVRDEARLLGGFGPCGKALCCATFLKDFEPVTIKMAKEQNLPLNPAKISGVCGRLMCCLGYEHKLYVELLRGLPKEGEKIEVEGGSGKVLSVNALKRSVTIDAGEGKIVEIPCKCPKGCPMHHRRGQHTG
ncbi:MAG: stage 0 sporulation family protein [Candidatus Omnitrophota bacterium]|nr:stage 0 sporulation family protein [Candidatus Omnitrophota bacterium]